MLKIPYEWIILICIVVAVILFGDAKPTDATSVFPQTKATSLGWTHIEPPETRIRMLWIIHSYVPLVNAGSEVCAHTINKYFMSKPYKYDIWVACPGYPKQTYEGVRCFDLHDTETLFKIVNSSHVLHSHSYIYRNQMRWLSRTTGLPFVEWVHTDNYVRSVKPDKWIDPTIQNRYWTVFNSESLKESRKLFGNVSSTNDYIVNPVVDYRQYAVGEDSHEKVYVTLSNVNENKGGKLLIQLARAMPDIQFQGILGGYRSQIVEHGIPNLKYIPNTTQIKDVYAQTWVLIMPSREETWGRTAVEAMSSGIPVIAAPTPGLRECCKDGALFCDRDDLDAWVSTLRKLKNDREFYNTRSVAAFSRARELDPHPDLEKLEKWVAESVCPSITSTAKKQATSFEKLLLFR
jgi:glycosyltransferase involved in cell wall biosynthesis